MGGMGVQEEAKQTPNNNVIHGPDTDIVNISLDTGPMFIADTSVVAK